MAQPTNTFSQYDAKGNREDLSDIIYDISPTETPFLSSIGKTKATSTKHEWQTDALAAAVSNTLSSKVMKQLWMQVSQQPVSSITRRFLIRLRLFQVLKKLLTQQADVLKWRIKWKNA